MARRVIHGKLAEYYDGIYGFKDYPREAAELTRVAARYLGRTPSSLLDVGCGTGVHLATFRKTMAAVGVDASPDMLRVARRRLKRSVRLVKGDMRRFSLRDRFDVLTCLFSAIGYMLTRRDRDLAMANFYKHLVPGGVALIEGWIFPERWRGTSVSLDSYEDDDTVVSRTASAWREANVSVVCFDWLLAKRGERTQHFGETVRLPLVSAEEMLGSLRRAGFRARVLREGRYKDRGLYVGVRPRAP